MKCVEITNVFKNAVKHLSMEDGVEISFSYHRNSFMPDADVSAESDELKALANALWTDDVKKAYADSKKED